MVLWDHALTPILYFKMELVIHIHLALILMDYKTLLPIHPVILLNLGVMKLVR